MTVKANYKRSSDELKEPGDFAFSEWDTERKMYQLCYICPCGRNDVYHSGHNCSVVIVDGPKIQPNDHIWSWDGNKEAPTLTPSINDLGCGWHGFLTKGVWKACGEN